MASAAAPNVENDEPVNITYNANNVSTNWRAKSALSKSLFAPNLTGDEHIMYILKPAKLPKDWSGQLGKIGRFRRTDMCIRAINSMMKKPTLTIEDVKTFNAKVAQLINDYNGNNAKGEITEDDAYCHFMGEKWVLDPDTKCKGPGLPIKLIMALEIYMNTIVLFYKKIKNSQPDLINLKNLNEISESLTLMISNLFYFAGRYHLGEHLISAFSQFIKKFNEVFSSFIEGSPLLVQTCKDGTYECGRGILWGQYKTKDNELHEGILIHKSVSKYNNSVNVSLVGNPPTIGGRSRRRMQKKKRRTHKRK